MKEVLVKMYEAFDGYRFFNTNACSAYECIHDWCTSDSPNVELYDSSGDKIDWIKGMSLDDVNQYYRDFTHKIVVHNNEGLDELKMALSWFRWPVIKKYVNDVGTWTFHYEEPNDEHPYGTIKFVKVSDSKEESK